jgi:hypothetical protein
MRLPHQCRSVPRGRHDSFWIGGKGLLPAETWRGGSCPVHTMKCSGNSCCGKHGCQRRVGSRCPPGFVMCKELCCPIEVCSCGSGSFACPPGSGGPPCCIKFEQTCDFVNGAWTCDF